MRAPAAVFRRKEFRQRGPTIEIVAAFDVGFDLRHRQARSWILAIMLEHDPEKWIPVFGKDHAKTTGLKRNDDST
jgi:hypothetical protein